ncbi:hypothetical protein [Spiroplasma poulsonii]|uniref:hypothetical protein n=1 Tax=Spiroplasma poulsonii TaxID=2138 RepID=UPI001F4C9969|nr:hypothetical protein [Spiroplasma poulsonii]UNF62629.1 hypothetical protein MNU24_04055 [Spiroplasma poulsonii]
MEQIKLNITSDNNQNWKINMTIKNITKSINILEPNENVLTDFFDEVIIFLMSDDVLLDLKEGKLSELKNNILVLPKKEEYPNLNTFEIPAGISTEFIDNFVREVHDILDDINSNLVNNFI